MIEAILFPLVFIVAIIEMILSGFWVRLYFRSGIPIYDRRHSAQPISQPIRDSNIIESLFPESKYPKLLFRSAGDNFFVFREKAIAFSGFTYTPVMHGNLDIDPYRGQVRVIGRLNWFTLVFSILFAVVPVYWINGDPVGFIFPVFLAGLLTFIYKIQHKRFLEVGELVSENIEVLQ